MKENKTKIESIERNIRKTKNAATNELNKLLICLLVFNKFVFVVISEFFFIFSIQQLHPTTSQYITYSFSSMN